ncbi:Ubiquitin domain-containing protein UBFD1 [Lepeophtheirus salmonis]|uniref:Ubiquitin domain-containing protein UBFD1 n=1 Tax=Lepeophtheirus salmonis TaxID=72036 RepID=A0A0K2U8Y4_LEPSM|nr:Ubiquitin domain-containing protein UBFD1 [Lepeophtheirus salmonis]CAF2777734.1 Ubiquitin domain-containing protein UBFD1 [Lepeophtheirus salmonis]
METNLVSSETGKSQEEILKESLSKVTGSKASDKDSVTLRGEKVDFKIIYNKKKFDISFGSENTVRELKSHLESIIQIPPAMMKVMIKGLAKDEMSLKELGVSKGSKVMIIGSSLDDVVAVFFPPTKDELESSSSTSSSNQEESLSKVKMHKKILDKGKPEDVMVGIKDVKDLLPSVPLSGMLNKYGGKVRLTFKIELDQLWIGTKERTEKLPMSSIKNVISESIEGHEEYHIMALQLGSTEASRYWIYWVPAQFVDAIKDSILGKWQFY